jgi:hypothetical protein
MLSGVQWEVYGGHGNDVREGKMCVMLSGMQWEGNGGHGNGVREGEVYDVERCEVGRLWGLWVWCEGGEGV